MAALPFLVYTSVAHQFLPVELVVLLDEPQTEKYNNCFLAIIELLKTA